MSGFFVGNDDTIDSRYKNSGKRKTQSNHHERVLIRKSDRTYRMKKDLELLGLSGLKSRREIYNVVYGFVKVDWCEENKIPIPN